MDTQEGVKDADIIELVYKEPVDTHNIAAEESSNQLIRPKKEEN